jgi:isopenicillin-N N-acyltransferase-like protein
MHSGNRKVSRRNFLSAVASGAMVGSRVVAATTTEYPLVRAMGSHRELGRQHGEQAADKIKSHVEIICAKGGYSPQQLSDRALAFRPLFEKYCPHLLEEIQGLADGARISLAEALAVNIRDPLSLAKVEGCTSFVVARTGTAQHQILAGKNCDMDPRVSSLGYVLHLRPVNKPEILIWTLGGMIGYHGINSAGAGIFDNALFGDGPANQWGMPHYPLKRMMLECEHVDQMIRLYKTVPLAANANYIVCDGHGNILDIEATTAGPEVITDRGAGFLVHTNHYVSPRYPGRKSFRADWKDSFPRLTRMNSLIQSKLGSLNVDDFKKFLSDHDGYPTSICRHLGPGNSISVASLIAEPAKRRMHVTFENSCRGRYVSYSM